MKVDVIDASRNKIGDAEVSQAVFGGKVNPALMHEMVVCQLANRRRGTHSAKGRSEVKCSGKKPWKQKGTGRARAGSMSSPLFNGGGVIFPPKPRDYSYNMPKKARRAALVSALSMKLGEGALSVIDKVELDEPKTKKAAGLLSSLGASGKVLMVVNSFHEATMLGFRNLQGVKFLSPEKLNVYDVLNHKHVFIAQDALTAIHERLLK